MDRATFERELGEILGLAYGYAVRLNSGDHEAAEDLLQEASISAFRGRDSFTVGTNFKAWFFKILTNAFYRRAGKKEVQTVSIDADPEPYLYLQAREVGIAGADDPAEILFNKIDTAEVKQALDNLPSEFREVSALYFTGEMSYEEISDTLNIPVGTVRSRLHRARKLLQVALWDLAVSRGIVEAVSYA
ncbi:MAG: sigma-70 family RNA polymerase sigma factor [Fimbriimonadaceae bacterium]|nr:MAG: sigma-70 family RNA polymerase sigma factor [Fimbriimonadaceae bacterium]